MKAGNYELYGKITAGKKIKVSFEAECPVCKKNATYTDIDLNTHGIVIYMDTYTDDNAIGVETECPHCKKEIVVQITDN